jgi:serine/threonine-protein kinase
MAPEQATGLTLDHRVDIYALGVVAYEVLAGKVPFSADNPIDVLMKHVQSPVPVVPDLPAPVMDALLKALAKKPQDRWQTAGALVAELEATIAQMPVVGASPTTPGMTALPLAGEFWTAEGTQPPAPPTVPSARPSPSADTSTPTRAYAPPPPSLPPRDSTIAVPTRPGAVRAGGVERASRTGLIAVIVAAVGVLGLAAAAGLYLYLRPDPAPLAETAPAAAEETARVDAGSPAEAAPPAATVPPRASAIERETADAPPVTVAPRAQPAAPAALPSVAPATRPAAAAVPITPAATVPAALGTLRLDVNAVQPAFGAMSSSVDIDVRVDGQPMRTVSIRFDGTTPFARSRRRQTFDIPGIRVGQRNLSVLVRADGVEEVQAATQLAVSEGGETVILDVRLRGNGEGDARFR